MISYAPLTETLSKKGISLTELASMLGVTRGSLTATFNTNQYFRIQTLLRMAEVLNVGVADLVEWKEGEGVSDIKMYTNINWETFTELCKNKGYSFTSLSKLLEHSSNFLTKAKCKQSGLNAKDIDAICRILEIKREQII